MPTKPTEQLPLGVMFALLTKWYVGALTVKLSALPIDRYFYVLTVIDEMNGEVTQKDLAEMVWTDKASMVRILDYLTEKGVIERLQDPTDRRAYRIRTTKLGQEIVPLIRSAYGEVHQSAVEGLPVADARAISSTLRKMACNLSQLPLEEMQIRLDRQHKKTT
jgi:DNA-binding MarR family transcriptional regulator